jgi:hypothetical protein
MQIISTIGRPAVVDVGGVPLDVDRQATPRMTVADVRQAEGGLAEPDRPC